MGRFESRVILDGSNQKVIDLEKNKSEFIEILGCVRRQGIESLLESLLEEGDFFKAPASSRYHGAFPGGLCAHSIAVYHQLKNLAELYAPGVYSEESLAIVSLFHDLCKVNVYKTEMRNVKKDGQWVQLPFYKFEENFAFGGHGEKSVFLVMEHMALTREEAVAINTHMGFAGAQNINAVSEAYDKNLLAWLLHVADEAATYITKI